MVFTHSSPVVNERTGITTSYYEWQMHWRSGRSNRRCEPPQIGPHDKGAIERLAPLTKKQYSGTWALDKGAIERVCAAEWLRRLSEGFGQGGRRSSWKSAYTLFLTVWTVRLLGTQLFKTVAWQSSASIQADRREWGSTKQVHALKSELDLDPEWWVHFIISNFIIPPIHMQTQRVMLVNEQGMRY